MAIDDATIDRLTIDIGDGRPRLISLGIVERIAADAGRCSGNGCGWGRVFRCARCTLLACWCHGAADDEPDICDTCWTESH